MCEIKFVVSFITMYNMCLYFAIIIVKHSQKFHSVFGAHIKKVTFTVLHQRDLRFFYQRGTFHYVALRLRRLSNEGVTRMRAPPWPGPIPLL
jgi:hypothetical protein